jgi:N-acetylglucosamine-6-sulfatase
MHSKMAVRSLLLVAFLSAFTFALARKPNIIMILTDDQDRRLGSLDYMPNLQRLVLAQGLTNTNHYGTVALCCPARATLLRGQAAHNTNITHVGGPGGGYPKFRHTGEMNDYLPLWLKKAGYTSAYIGKFMNGYNSRAIPPEGWGWLDILVSPWIYSFNHVVMKQNNAKPVYYDGWHQTDVLRINAPRMPNWNPADDQHIGKPAWVGELAQMNESVIESSDEAMRARLQGLQGVDEIVEDVVALLAQRHILQDTYSKWSR